MKAAEAPPAWPVMLAVGAAALAGQSLLVRELMVSFQGTEPALVAVLACWLLFVPVGALAGAVARRGGGPAAWLFRAALAALAVGVVLGPAVARCVRVLLGVEVGVLPGAGAMMVGAAVSAAPVAFWVGFIFPLASALEADRAGSAPRGVGAVYVAEAAGSAAAGALLSFCLLGRVDHFAIACGASVLLAGAGGLHALAGGRRAGALVLIALALGLAVGWGAWGRRLAASSERARWDTFSRFGLVAALDSRYQHVQLGEREGAWVVLQDGAKSLEFPDPAGDRQRAALLLTQHPAPRAVLVIGGGLGGLCQALTSAGPAVVDYVEPDPEVIRLVAAHLPSDLAQALSDARFAAWLCDGRGFVRQVARGGRPACRAWQPGARAGGAQRVPAGHYDLIVLNVGDPTSAAASRFYTTEFFHDAAGALDEGGVLAVCGITGSENYLASGPVRAYAGCLYATLRSVFGRVIVRPGDELCFFAGRPATASVPELERRFGSQGLEPAVLRYMFGLEQFPPARVRSVTEALDSASAGAELHLDERPVLFTLFLEVQRLLTASARPSGAPGLHGRVRRVPPAVFWLPWAALPLLVAGVRAARGAGRARAWASAGAVLTTGAFGMAAEMLIVYRYQTAFGYVYRDVSLIAGLFMAGVAVGGWLSGRAGGGRWLAAVEGGQAVVALGLPAALGALGEWPGAFMGASALAGLLTGATFPLAGRLSLAGGRRAAGVAGLLAAADGLGALVGAACAGLVLIPVFGVIATGCLVALAKCASLAAGLLGACCADACGAGRPGL